ncbi:MAG: autotransporter outer membrane beta-barrel domain-containing protein [Phascolarctobacterium sp.]|nr:autotransporter outer membrane beta-barrel domain-containing protein [Phascolarctobacterium sp.]
MSKKMMKRSLALGALMAFVITGSAMAETPNGWNSVNWATTSSTAYVYVAKEDNTSGDLNVTVDGTNVVMVVGRITGSKDGSYPQSQGNGGSVTIGENGFLANSIIACGGMAFAGDANDNKVIFSGSHVGIIYGGYAIAGNANNNEVIINGGNVADICGGMVSGGTYNADGNKVTINGGTVTSSVRGAYATGAATGSNNIISLQGDADVSGARIYGFEGNGTGNKLNIDESYTGSKIGEVSSFDEIEIEKMEYGKPLEVGSMYYKDTNEDGTGGTKITVNKMTMSGNEELSEGTELQIINADSNNLSSGVNKGAISSDSSVTIHKGASEIIDVTFGGEDVSEDGTIKIDNVYASRNDQVLVIGESRAAATAFVNQGSELVETGLDALARDNAKAGDTKAFAAVYGNASEYATGSHVKVNGWSGIVGVGKTNANGLTVGAFFENGTGNYRTYNTVNNDFMRGDGEATYNGGGFLVRKDNTNGVYTEASLRAGNLQNELRKAVRGSEGLTGYDVDTFYYGAHVGVGKIIPRGNEGDSIDVYGKFIYTHHDSENFEIDGSDFHFDSVDSERLRLGFRINEVQSNKLSMYYGAAWEYEFGGDADNTTVGYDLSTPSLGGSTMIGEIGMHYLASEKWSLDLNVRGYSGQRDGFTGSVQANYSF